MNGEKNRKIIQQSLQILFTEHSFTLDMVQQKMAALGIEVGRTSIYKLKNQKGVGPATVHKVVKGLTLLLKREYCLQFDEQQDVFKPIANCQPAPVTVVKEVPAAAPEYLIHDGRRDVTDKVDMYQLAQKEVLEIGIRLKNFRSYFEEKRESAFLSPLKDLLNRGVNFKCFALNPKGNIARKYIEDRASAQVSEQSLLEDIPRISNELQQLFHQINREVSRGKISLYQYDHFPYYHATVIDGGMDHSCLNIAPYLYGLSRANTPVIEVHRKQHKILYKKYWRSINALTRSPRMHQLV